jgi:hypothetical protein
MENVLLEQKKIVTQITVSIVLRHLPGKIG